MGSIVSAIFGGGSSPANNIQNASTVAQANEQYGNVQQNLKQQQDFLAAVQAQNGLGNQSNVFNQLQGVASGTGPNPAQAMLANATGANVANQNALAAGQRGAGTNVGMIQRQAAQQGAGIQQNAAGQAAQLQAQQSLGALGQAGSIAGQQVGNQAAATNAAASGALQAHNQVLQGIQGQNANQAQLAGKQMDKESNIISGLTGAVGTGLGFMFGGPAGAAIGGQLLGGGGGDNSGGLGDFSKQWVAEGGMIQSPSGPKSNIGKSMHMMAKGGPVPAMVSPGEAYLPPQKVEQVKQGANPLSVGEKIPGKPKVKGDSYQNDTVHKTLQEGGIVIPNSIMQSKDASKKAAEFVAAVLKKQSLKKGK